MKGDLARERILKGQCPLCGKEAAPYRLCWEHRQYKKFSRTLRRGAKLGALTREKRIDGKIYYNIGDKNAKGRWGSTPLELPESDKRSHPRLRGIRVDVEATIAEVMRYIGRPCTIEEIQEAWGKLRDRRTSPLPADLARILAAQDRRAARNARRAAIAAKQNEEA